MALLKVKDVAAELGISKDMAYREIRAGNLKAVRIGSRMLRIFPEELKDYQQRQTVKVEKMVVL